MRRAWVAALAAVLLVPASASAYDAGVAVRDITPPAPGAGSDPAALFEERDQRLIALKKSLRDIGSMAGFRE